MSLVLYLFLLSQLNTNAAPPAEVVLAVGHSATLHSPGTNVVRVANGRLVKVVEVRGRLLALGRRPGSTTVTLDQRVLSIHVLDTDSWRLYELLREQIRQFKGLILGVKNGIPVIRGELYRLSDWQSLTEVALAERGRFLFSAQLWPDLVAPARAWIGETLRRAGVVAARVNPNRPWQIEVPPGVQRRVEAIVSRYGLEILESESLIRVGPSVRLKLTFAEIHRSAASRLGLEVSDGQTLQLVPRSGLTGSLDATLQFLEAKGLAKTLATPFLTAKSGTDAEFLSGGEFPVRISSFQKREVVWKRHGLYLKIKPAADSQKRVHLEITFELSAPQSDDAVDGIPSLRATRLNNQIDAPDGGTVALSGLFRQFLGRGRSQIPGFGDIPLLGAIFGSQVWQRQESDMVIFISPTVLDEGFKDEIQLPKGFENGL